MGRHGYDKDGPATNQFTPRAPKRGLKEASANIFKKKKTSKELTPNTYPRRKVVVERYDISFEILNSLIILCEADDGADEAKVL